MTPLVGWELVGHLRDAAAVYRAAGAEHEHTAVWLEASAEERARELACGVRIARTAAEARRAREASSGTKLEWVS